MSQQTSYDNAQAAAFAGLLADLDGSYVRGMRNMETAAVPFGIGVIQGTGANDFQLPDSAGDDVIGVLAHSHNAQAFSASIAQGLDANQAGNVVFRGAVYVKVEEAVAPGDDVYCRHTANGAGKLQPGAFRKDADSGNALAVQGARWLTSTAGAGIAALLFDSVANAPKTVATTDLENLAVTAAKLAADAVETAKIKDGAVTEGKLGAGAVTAAKLGAGSVSAAKMANATAEGISGLIVISKAIEAGVGGGADDVDLGVPGMKCKVLDAKVFVATAGAGGSTATLRTAQGAGGTALSGAMSVAAQGEVRSTTLQAVPELAAADHIYCRRSDNTAALTVVAVLQPIA